MSLGKFLPGPFQEMLTREVSEWLKLWQSIHDYLARIYQILALQFGIPPGLSQAGIDIFNTLTQDMQSLPLRGMPFIIDTTATPVTVVTTYDVATELGRPAVQGWVANGSAKDLLFAFYNPYQKRWSKTTTMVPKEQIFFVPGLVAISQIRITPATPSDPVSIKGWLI